VLCCQIFTASTGCLRINTKKFSRSTGSRYASFFQAYLLNSPHLQAIMRLLSRFSENYARKSSPPRERPTISDPIPFQPPESKEHHLVCLPLSSHPIYPSKSDASLAKQHSGTPERRKGRNSATERPSRPDKEEEKGGHKEPRNRRYGIVFTKEILEQFELEGKKGMNAYFLTCCR
jgi:hypothetical protein